MGAPAAFGRRWIVIGYGGVILTDFYFTRVLRRDILSHMHLLSRHNVIIVSFNFVACLIKLVSASASQPVSFFLLKC